MILSVHWSALQGVPEVSSPGPCCSGGADAGAADCECDAGTSTSTNQFQAFQMSEVRDDIHSAGCSDIIGAVRSVRAIWCSNCK